MYSFRLEDLNAVKVEMWDENGININDNYTFKMVSNISTDWIIFFFFFFAKMFIHL